MALFAYRALTAGGERTQGTIDASDSGAAIRQLQDSGLIPIDAVPTAAGERRARGPKLSGRSVKSKDVTQFTREMAVLLGAGQPLEWSLDILAEEAATRPIGLVLRRVLERVRGGMPLSVALTAEPGCFAKLYINMVRAGEATGSLDRSLSELANMRESTERLRRRLGSALLYPAVLVFVSIASIALLFILVVPQFEPLFAQAGKSLPASTVFIMAIAGLFRDYGLFVLIVLLLAILLAVRLLGMPGPRQALDRTLLRLPLIGTLVRDQISLELARGISVLLAAGLDLPSTLALTRDMLSNRAAASGMDSIIGGVRQGRMLADCLQEHDFLAPMALRMIRVGEETGRLVPTSAHVAATFEERVTTRLTAMVGLLEPVLVIGLGVVVGGIVMSILTAVISVNDLAF